MHTRMRSGLLAWGVVGLLAWGCTTPGAENVESLDASKWEPNEGVFAVRVFTSMSTRDKPDEPRVDPDIEYTLAFGTSSSPLKMFRLPDPVISVNAKQGPKLAVRKLPAGEYFFNEIAMQHPGGWGGGPGVYLHFPMAVKFTVRPGQITYVGDLKVCIVEEGGALGLGGVYRCDLSVSSEPAAVKDALSSRYPGQLPEIETIPMIIGGD